MENLTAIIEAILFVSGDPVRVDVLAHAMNLTVSELEEALSGLRDHLALEAACARLEEARREQDEKMEEWEELAGRLEELEGEE